MRECKLTPRHCKGPWEDVATAIETEITLVDQPERVELEYRIIALNKAGES